MLIIPAIDIVGGKCVRLTQGDYSKMKEYCVDPVEVALQFKNYGAKFLHIIDLEGAREGKSINLEKILEISKTTGLNVQTGGGIRTIGDAKKILNSGIKRIILGTVALKDFNLVKDLISEFGEERIAVSIDVKDGKIMAKGWIESSKLKLKDVLKGLKEAGLKYLIYTDILRDGMLKGIDLEAIKMILKSDFNVIVAGGVSSNKDVKELEKAGAYGCIIGKAIYEDKIEFNQKSNLAKRIIACMDIKDGRVVKGTNFVNLKDAGDPVELGKLYSEMGADELVFLDIIATVEERETLYELVKKISENINIPFTVGGGISSILDIRNVLGSGADKISINTAAVENPSLISKASEVFGSQCIVVAIDVKRIGEKYKVFIKGGTEETSFEAVSWAKMVEELGAGEILLTSMDMDGTREGYDNFILKQISGAVKIPVIASGGVGNKEHLKDGIEIGKADAVLAASIFHYGQYSISEVKKYLRDEGIAVRL